MKKKTIALLVWAVCSLAITGWARDAYTSVDGESSLSLKSSLKALWEHSPRVSDQASANSFWRLRLEPMYKINSEWSLDLAWDMHSLLGTTESETSLLPSMGSGYLRVSPLGSITRQASLTSQQELDRAWVAYQPAAGSFTLGRQAIGWGRGVFFSAVDIFAAFSPLEVDQEWRRGVDAMRGDIKLTDQISLDLVAAPGSDPNQTNAAITLADSAFAGRVRGDLGVWDAEVIAGRRGDDRLGAVTVSLPLGDLEVHGEAAVFLVPGDIPDAGLFGNQDLVPKAVLGASNHFNLGQGLTMAVEYHYSGFGVGDIRTYAQRLAQPAYLKRFTRGDSQIIGKQAVAFQLAYTINELLQGGFNLLQSATDNSGVLMPSLTWNYAENVTLLLNGLWAYGQSAENGRLQSQFGNKTPTWLVQIRLYD